MNKTQGPNNLMQLQGVKSKQSSSKLNSQVEDLKTQNKLNSDYTEKPNNEKKQGSFRKAR